MNLKILILILVASLIGCATAPKHVPSAPVRTETVEVAKYTSQPVDPSLTAPIVVAKPPADCNDSVSPVWCGKTFKRYRILLESALTTCNDDRAAIRAGTPVGQVPGG